MPLTTREPSPLIAAQESQLLGRLKAGDGTAFEEFVRGYGGRMLAVARRILRDEEESRDALQDAFLLAFRGLESFQGQSRLSTWMHRITANAALMKLRSRRRRPEDPIDDLLPRFYPDGHRIDPGPPWRDDPAGALEGKETAALVRDCIDRLPESYRTVLVLRDVEDLDTSETAQALGITADAVKMRLHRARQALRTLLDPHFREPQVRRTSGVASR